VPRGGRTDPAARTGDDGCSDAHAVIVS